MTIKQALVNDERLKNIRDEALLRSLRNGSCVYLCVRGLSMYPSIKDYDSLRIEPAENIDLLVGDIVLVALENKFLIHRLVKIQSENGPAIFYTKGDNTLGRPEGPFNRESIAGRVIMPKVRSGAFIAFVSLYLPWFCRLFTRLASGSRAGQAKKLLTNTRELFLIAGEKPLSKADALRPVNLIKAGIRWNCFLEYITQGAKTFLARDNLAFLANQVNVPEFVTKRLDQACEFINAENETRLSQLVDLLAVFKGHGIDVILLKGLGLSVYLYNDPNYRGLSVDTDLLIRQEQLEQALKLLKDLGFNSCGNPEIALWQWQRDFSRSGFNVDIHWDITMENRTPARFKDICQSCQDKKVNISGKDLQLKLFDNEMLLIYLCLQITNSRDYRSAKTVFDIKRLLRPEFNINWQTLAKKAKELGFSGSVYAGLTLTESLMENSLGERAVAFKPSFFKRAFIRVFLNKKVMFTNCLRRKILDGFLSYILFELIEVNSIGRFFKTVKKVFFLPPGKFIKSGLPDGNFNDLTFFQKFLYFKLLGKRVFTFPWKFFCLVFSK